MGGKTGERPVCPQVFPIFLGLCLAVLTGIGRATTGSYSFLSGDFWFTAGLLLLILLSIVDQPHFSKDANVFMNGGWPTFGFEFWFSHAAKQVGAGPSFAGFAKGGIPQLSTAGL